MTETPAKNAAKVIGVISDTHGLVRPEALQALQGVDLLIHAGDIGSPEVLACLGSIACVAAVRGNIDRDCWARAIPEERFAPVGRSRIYVLHDVNQMRLNPVLEGIHVVISGHSHRPSITEKNGVVYFNPGSAGPRRFKLPVAVGRMEFRGAHVKSEIIELSI